MLKLTITKNDEYANFVLEDNTGKEYEANINFMNIEKPKVGTEIYIQKEVLDENVSLNYGPVSESVPAKEDELIVIVNGNEKKYLQRYYG